MAKARKLPSGSWRVQCYAGKNAEGKNQYRSFTRPTKKEAEYEAALFAMHYKEISRDSTAMTLAEAMDKYIASKDGILSPSTIRGYDIIRKNHLKGLMDIRLNRLTPALIQEAINQEAKPYIDKNGKTRTPSPKSVRNIHGLLTAVLGEYCPGLRLNTTLPQKQAAEQSILEPEEIAQTDLATGPPESLQQETAEGMTLEGSLGTEAPEEGLVERIALREAIDRLPEKERMTILLRYFKGLTQEQTARVVGVSQVQISRLERRGLKRLRESFEE